MYHVTSSGCISVADLEEDFVRGDGPPQTVLAVVEWRRGQRDAHHTDAVGPDLAGKTYKYLGRG